jgi:hypothetical protein
MERPGLPGGRGSREGGAWQRARGGVEEEHAAVNFREEVEKSWFAAVFGGALGQTGEAGPAGRGRRKEDGGLNGSTRIGGEEQYSG